MIQTMTAKTDIVQASKSPSPRQRAWQRFKQNRLGFYSFVILCVLVLISLCAELIANDKPLIVKYQGQFYYPLMKDYPETTFGGDFETTTDYLDPFIKKQLNQNDNWAIFPIIPYGQNTINYFAKSPSPTAPNRDNWLGTDDQGRDLLAQLIYGFRLSIMMGLGLTLIGTVIGVLIGAIQGYFAGKVDLIGQRLIEVWSSLPSLYILIILSSIFKPSVLILFILLVLFSWMGLVDYVRAEFLKNRQMDYARSAKALGASHWRLIFKHLLPNSMTPVVTFVPFAISAAILSLTSLDFLGLGVPPGTPSLGQLLNQGKSNTDAWWISASTFMVLVVTLSLLTFMGDALRDALDPRKRMATKALELSKKAKAAQKGLAAQVLPSDIKEVNRPSNGRLLLSIKDLSIAFGAEPVVKSVSFDVYAGDKLALVGESGSGKTVTALSILGLNANAQTTGQIDFEGRNLLSLGAASWQAVRGRDVAMIFQEPMTALNPLLTVGEQIAESVQRHMPQSAQSAWTRVHDLLREVEIAEPERRARQYPHQLSGGQRQRILIAMALAAQPKLLLADEPTTALDVNLRQQILQLLDRLCQTHDMALVLITHDLPLVKRFASRVVVMQHGHVVEQGEVAQILTTPQHPYTHQLIHSAPVRDVDDANPDAVVQLSAQQLSVRYFTPLGGFKGWFQRGEFVAANGVSFALRAGQTVAVVGESGSGKSTVALAVLRLLSKKQVQGQIQPEASLTFRRTVQAVFQDPFASLSPRMTVLELVQEGLQIHQPSMDAAVRRAKVVQMLQDVGLTEEQFPNLLDRYPHEFSGGQRQRIALARALVVEPDVLVLDEPTSALDVSVQQQVVALLQRIQRERGLSYLLITHDMAVVKAMAHEVLVMQKGRVIESGPALQVLQSPQHTYTQTLLA